MPTETPQDRPLSDHHRTSPPNYGPEKNGNSASSGGVGPPHMQHDLEVAQACLNLRQESKGDPHRQQGGPSHGHDPHGSYGHHDRGLGPGPGRNPPGPGPEGELGGGPNMGGPNMGREGPPNMGGPNMSDDPRNSAQTPQQMDPRSSMMNSGPPMPPNMPPNMSMKDEGGEGRLGGMHMQQMPGHFMPPHMMELGGPNGLPPGAMKEMHPYYQQMGDGGGSHFYPQFHSPDADPYHAMMNGMGMRDMSQYYGMMNQGEGGMMHPNGHFYPPMMPPEAGHFSPMMQGYPHGAYIQQKRPHPGDDMSYHQPDMKRGRTGAPTTNMKQDDIPMGGTKKIPEKQKKGKRASDMPRRPLSAYNFFFSEERERILAAIPDPDQRNKDDNNDTNNSEKKIETASPDNAGEASKNEETGKGKTTSETEQKKDEKPETEGSKVVEQETKGDGKKDEKDEKDEKVDENESGEGEKDGDREKKEESKDESKKDEEKDESKKDEGKDESKKDEVSSVTKKQIAEKMAARSKRLLALREQQSNKRRPHRKTHGKIGFKELVKKIGERWRALPAEEKEYYSSLAKTDLRRYKEQMTEYNNKHNRIGV